MKQTGFYIRCESSLPLKISLTIQIIFPFSSFISTSLIFFVTFSLTITHLLCHTYGHITQQKILIHFLSYLCHRYFNCFKNVKGKFASSLACYRNFKMVESIRCPFQGGDLFLLSKYSNFKVSKYNKYSIDPEYSFLSNAHFDIPS